MSDVIGSQVDSLLRELTSRWREREVIRLTAIIQEKAYNRQDISAEINELVLLGEQTHSEVEVFDIVEYADKPINELVDDRTFIKTGIEGLDHRIHGIEPEQLIFIAAESGQGKTTLSWQIMNNIQNSLFITLEETRENLYIKLLSRISQVNSFKFKHGNFYGSEIERIDEAREWIKGNITTKVVDSDVNLIEIITVIKKQHRAGKCSVVGIENVSLISGGIGDTKADKFNYISRTLKKLAKELRIPILLMSQQNKDSYNGEPTMSDLNYLAPNDADYIWFCWDSSVVIAKGRTAQTGRIPDIEFQKEISNFKTLGVEKYDNSGRLMNV
jgi:replicative DNA helicase